MRALFPYNACAYGRYLATNVDEVPKFGDGFALCVLELTRKVCRRDPAQKARFVRSLFAMLSSNSAAVSYEAAWTLVSLSSAPTAVRAAAATYAGLLNSQSDNNVKLIVLERIAALMTLHSKVLQEVLMDLLRALNSPNIDICKRTLEVAMDLVGPRNIDEVVAVLKREVVRTRDSDAEKGGAYRTLLIKSIHQCAVKFPEVAESVVHVLMDFLNTDGAMDVIVFVRAIVEQYPSLRESVLRKLLTSFGEMTAAPVINVGLWILGEYCTELSLVTEAFEELVANLGEPPFAAVEESTEKEAEFVPEAITKNIVLADGTYATQTTMTEPPPKPAGAVVAHLRKLLIDGDVYLGGVATCAVTKLALRALDLRGATHPEAKGMQAKAVLVACGVAKVAQTKCAASGNAAAFADSLERITLCCRLLLDPHTPPSLKASFLNESKASFALYLAAAKKNKESSGSGSGGSQAEKDAAAPPRVQADDLINFRQLRRKGATGGAELDFYDGDDLSKAAGSGNGAGDLFASHLNHVYQLSGFADPVYAEACVTVHDYDIVLEILVVNRTPNTLTNLTVELATMGDLKLVERPQALTIGPLDQRTIKANIKVSSTETGHIFGTIAYENSSNAEKSYINLNDVHLDIMDYIKPHTCTDEAFRGMWAEFEWENKVAINTTFTELGAFLKHVVEHTNMCCLTPLSSLGGASTFLAANLYAKSIFGEDALVNVSVEKKADADGKLTGYIRIRSKTQGIALSLGDRITLVQRGAAKGKDGAKPAAAAPATEP